MKFHLRWAIMRKRGDLEVGLSDPPSQVYSFETPECLEKTVYFPTSARAITWPRCSGAPSKVSVYLIPYHVAALPSEPSLSLT